MLFQSGRPPEITATPNPEATVCLIALALGTSTARSNSFTRSPIGAKDGAESALHSPEVKMVYANMRAVGVERTTQATDLGQKTNPPVAEG